MIWTMPRPVLTVVALLIGGASLGAFILGVATAPPRGRLPGERLDGVTGKPIEATDATPLVDERIQGAPEPTPLTEAEKAKLEADKKAKAEAAALARAEAENGAPAGPMPAATAIPEAPPTSVEGAPPPAVAKPEEPVF